MPLEGKAMQWSVGITYAVFAVLVLATLARLRLTAHPAVLRMLAVLAGALVSACELLLHGYSQDRFISLWAAALLGVAAISLMARYLPERLSNLLYGKESKQ
jgi:uncharacterized membrane protein